MSDNNKFPYDGFNSDIDQIFMSAHCALVNLGVNRQHIAEMEIQKIQKYADLIKKRISIYPVNEVSSEIITDLCRRAYETSKAHGWKHDNDGQAIALMHSELSEALEAMRKPGTKDEHLSDLDPVGLELADVVIRVFDFCGARGIDLAGCIKAKMDYNDRRPMKHGGKLF